MAHGYQAHGLITGGETPAEGWLRQARSQGVVGQYRCRYGRHLQGFHGMAMKDGAPRLTRFSVDDRTDLRVREHLAPGGHAPALPSRSDSCSWGQYFIAEGCLCG